MKEYFLYKKNTQDVESFVLIKDEISSLACFFPFVYLLINRLYGYASITFCSKLLLGALAGSNYISSTSAILLSFIVNAFIATSSSQWRREKLEMEGYKLFFCGRARDDLAYIASFTAFRETSMRSENIEKNTVQETIVI